MSTKERACFERIGVRLVVDYVSWLKENAPATWRRIDWDEVHSPSDLAEQIGITTRELWHRILTSINSS